MHSESESEFARILTGIEERTGLSHQRIADAAGVDRSQVWRWVRAGSNPGYEPVRRLAAWLIAERPEVADAAASLLPAAGYEIPPGTRGPQPGQNLLPGATPEMELAMEAHLARIRDRLEVARAAHPGGKLTGAMVFPRSPRDAESWDRLASLGWAPEAVARGLAALLAWDEQAAEAGQRGEAAGLAAAAVT